MAASKTALPFALAWLVTLGGKSGRLVLRAWPQRERAGATTSQPPPPPPPPPPPCKRLSTRLVMQPFLVFANLRSACTECQCVAVPVLLLQEASSCWVRWAPSPTTPTSPHSSLPTVSVVPAHPLPAAVPRPLSQPRAAALPCTPTTPRHRAAPTPPTYPCISALRAHDTPPYPSDLQR